MRAKDVRELSDDELVTKERDLAESLAMLRLRFRTNQLESPARMGLARRDIARIRTVRRERELKRNG
jgi:large subunit ribosomal protein L29